MGDGRTGGSTGPTLSQYRWFLAALLLFVVGTLLVVGPALASVSLPVRVAVVLFLAAEFLIPLWVYLDLRRRPDDANPHWIHAAAMPVINLFGLVAYLEERRRSREERSGPDGGDGTGE